ncbi:MAG: hypothetical protein WCJ63_08145 [Actinomycetes bacterium]
MRSSDLPNTPTRLVTAPLAQSVGLAVVCFMFAALVEGTHPGEAAVAATAIVGTAGPGGSTSLAGELNSTTAALRALLGSLFRVPARLLG